MATFLTYALIGITIPLVYRWLARKYPAPERSTEGPTLAELAPKYRKWEGGLTLAYIILWFPMIAAVFTPLHFLARWRAQTMQIDNSTLVFFADWTHLVPALFMAILLSAYVVILLAKIILKDRYGEFERYMALKSGFDQVCIMRGLSIIVCSVFLLAVLALFDAYVVASPQELRVNPLFGLERHYHYSEISEIESASAFIAPNGNTVPQQSFLIKFKDGTSFSTRWLPDREILNRSESMLIQAIVKWSGISIREKKVFERGDL